MSDYSILLKNDRNMLDLSNGESFMYSSSSGNITLEYDTGPYFADCRGEIYLGETFEDYLVIFKPLSSYSTSVFIKWDNPPAYSRWYIEGVGEYAGTTNLSVPYKLLKQLKQKPNLSIGDYGAIIKDSHGETLFSSDEPIVRVIGIHPYTIGSVQSSTTNVTVQDSSNYFMLGTRGGMVWNNGVAMQGLKIINSTTIQISWCNYAGFITSQPFSVVNTDPFYLIEFSAD